MDRCTNCGAPTRVDAKFCTTCGFRLAEWDDADNVPPAQAAPAADPAGPAPDVTPAAPAWPAPVTDSSWPVPDGPAAEPTTWEVPPLQPADTTWPTTPTPDATPGPVVGVWGAGTTWDGWNLAESTGSAELAVAETATFEPAPVEAAPAEVAHFAPPLDSVEAAEAATAPVAVGADPWQYPEAHEALGPAVAPPSADRLRALLDEARDLVPLLAATSAAAVDQRALAADLDAALAANRLEIDDLRAALERAREHPRDIDTILDLTGRVDSVILLLDAHDRLRSSVASAAERLRASAR